MGFSKKQHLTDNIEAIKTVLDLEKTKATPTPEQLETLQKFVGFGALKCVLLPAKSFDDISYWTNSELDLFPLVSELHRVLQENTDEKTYKRYMDSIKSSVLTAFYTPDKLVQTLGNVLQENNISVNRMLEPSAGMGTFLSAMGNNNSVAFEKDLLTAKLLQYTHPKTTINAEGFETIDRRYTNYFDVVASNIPFGDFKVFDPVYSKSNDTVKIQATKNIHNNFFIKSVDTLREGGLLAFITSQGVLNSPKNEPIRRRLMEQTHLVSAIRLPNNLFTDNAGTEVGSDFILLQKDSQKQELSVAEKQFVESLKTADGINTNGLFHLPDNIVSNNTYVDTDPYGEPAIIHNHTGGINGITRDFKEILQKDISLNYRPNLYLQQKEEENTIEVQSIQQEPEEPKKEQQPKEEPKIPQKKITKTSLPKKKTPKKANIKAMKYN